MSKKIWLERSKIKNVYPYLSQNIICDTLVIGGGISGAITSFILASEGRNIVVIDKNIIGYKNTLNCSGSIADFIDELYIKIGKEENIIRDFSNLKNRAIETLKQMLSKVKCSGNNSNYLILDNRLFQKKNLKKEIMLRNSLQEACDFLLNEENINANNIVEISKGAYNINPYLFTQNIFEYILENYNAKVYENTDAKFIEANYDDVKIHTQNEFVIKAKNVIITTPIEAIDFVSLNPDVELFKRFSLVSNSVFKENMYAKVLNDIPLYIRNDKDKVILSGNDLRYSNKMKSENYMDDLMEDTEKKFGNILKKLFPKYNLSTSKIYNSNIIKTKDYLPIISEVDMFPNVYLNIGCGGNGIMQSIVGGNILKDVVRGYYPKEMNHFKLKRF